MWGGETLGILPWAPGIVDTFENVDGLVLSKNILSLAIFECSLLSVLELLRGPLIRNIRREHAPICTPTRCRSSKLFDWYFSSTLLVSPSGCRERLIFHKECVSKASLRAMHPVIHICTTHAGQGPRQTAGVKGTLPSPVNSTMTPSFSFAQQAPARNASPSERPVPLVAYISAKLSPSMRGGGGWNLALMSDPGAPAARGG